MGTGMGMGGYGLSPFGVYGANHYMMGPEYIHKMQDLDDAFKHIPPSMWPGAMNPVNHMGLFGGATAPYRPSPSSGGSTSGTSGGSATGTSNNRGSNGRSSSSS